MNRHGNVSVAVQGPDLAPLPSPCPPWQREEQNDESDGEPKHAEQNDEVDGELKHEEQNDKSHGGGDDLVCGYYALSRADGWVPGMPWQYVPHDAKTWKLVRGSARHTAAGAKLQDTSRCHRRRGRAKALGGVL